MQLGNLVDLESAEVAQLDHLGGARVDRLEGQQGLVHRDHVAVGCRADLFQPRQGQGHQLGLALGGAPRLGMVDQDAAHHGRGHGQEIARDLAQTRFEDLRGLAHAVLFDYHDLVEPLGGSTPVRKRLVEDALTYLDRLNAGAPRDRGVRREIGMAYHTVGFVQEGALTSYERSVTLLRQLVAEDENDQASAYELALALSARAGLLGQDMQLAPARLGLDEAAALFTRHMAHDTPDLRHRLELARTHLRLTDILLRHRLGDEARARLAEARRTLESLAALQPGHKELPHVWVWVHNIESSMARENCDWPGVIAAEEQVRARLLALQAREPDNARFREDLAGSAQWLMLTYGRLGDVALVDRWGEEATSRWRQVARADPDDRNARGAYLRTLATSGWAYVEARAPERGLQQLDAVQAGVSALTLRFNADFDTRRQQAAFTLTRALAQAAAGRPAVAEARRVLDALQSDFADGAGAGALASALPALQAALDLAANGAGAGSGEWLQEVRAALLKLGVR